jgi:hypothetical protein
MTRKGSGILTDETVDGADKGPDIDYLGSRK